MNMEKFTERSRGFLQAAQTIAIRMNHQRITPEHLLKALLEDSEGMAAGLIKASGGDAATATRKTGATTICAMRMPGATSSTSRTPCGWLCVRWDWRAN